MENDAPTIAGGMVPGGEEDPVAVAAVSAAISLKRIADALTGPDAGRAIADNIYHGISTALFEAWQRGAPR